MAHKRFTSEEIIGLLRRAEIELSKGKTVSQACKLIGVTEQTYYRWRKEYGGLRTDQAKRLKELEKENARLKKVAGGRGTGQGDFEGGRLGKLLSPAKRRAAVEHVRRYPGSRKRSPSGVRVGCWVSRAARSGVQAQVPAR